MDIIVHSDGDTSATDVDSEVHSAGAQDTVATDVDAAVHSDGDKVMSAKSSTIDVAVDQPEGPNAVADAIVYPEGVAFATDVNAAVHSVGEKARAEERSATDVDAIIHSEGNSIATDVESDVHPAGTQDFLPLKQMQPLIASNILKASSGDRSILSKIRGIPCKILFCTFMKLIK